VAPTLVDSVSRRSQLITAAVVVALGLLVAFMVDVHPESLRIPAWVAYVAASAFVFAGLCLLASAITMTYRLQRWLGVAVTVSLFVVCAWVAFGPGQRECSVSLPFVKSITGDAICRGAFGIGAILMGLFLLLVLRRAFADRSVG